MGGAPLRVIVLGSTGSIGVQTLEVIRALHQQPAWPRFQVVGLAAGRNAELLGTQAAEFNVSAAVVSERDGLDAVERMVRETPCDLVVAAMVGLAGLVPTMAAMERRTPIALANKETLVAAGHLMTGPNASLLPIDSEHSAIWQCLGG